jgi:hypothetical protein
MVSVEKSDRRGSGSLDGIRQDRVFVFKSQQEVGTSRTL